MFNRLRSLYAKHRRESMPNGRRALRNADKDVPPAYTEDFKKAVEWSIQDGEMTTDTLQRRLRCGYAHAKTILDLLIDNKVLDRSSDPCKCLIDSKKAVLGSGYGDLDRYFIE